jgi:hypothetical protein
VVDPHPYTPEEQVDFDASIYDSITNEFPKEV